MTPKNLIRIDDIGAASKIYNQYGKSLFTVKGYPVFYFPFAQISFFKRIWPFKGWGPYQELTPSEWEGILAVFKKNNIRPLIGITACWVDEKNQLIPFPEKFPQEAAFLKSAFQKGDILIANHGLTHCVVGKHLPRFSQSNRQQHREFWPELAQEIHTEHIQKSQAILENFFEKPIITFIPPGNVWSYKTYKALQGTSIKQVTCNRYMLDSDETMEGIEFLDDQINTLVLHDRDLKVRPLSWLEQKIKSS